MSSRFEEIQTENETKHMLEREQIPERQESAREGKLLDNDEFNPVLWAARYLESRDFPVEVSEELVDGMVPVHYEGLGKAVFSLIIVAGQRYPDFAELMHAYDAHPEFDESETSWDTDTQRKIKAFYLYQMAGVHRRNSDLHALSAERNSEEFDEYFEAAEREEELEQAYRNRGEKILGELTALTPAEMQELTENAVNDILSLGEVNNNERRYKRDDFLNLPVLWRPDSE